jgi:type I restriction enzyme S subunit
MIESEMMLDTLLDFDRTLWIPVHFGDVVHNVNDNESNPLDNGIERYVGLDHLDPESLHFKRW